MNYLTVGQLRSLLSTLSDDAPVSYVYDGMQTLVGSAGIEHDVDYTDNSEGIRVSAPLGVMFAPIWDPQALEGWVDASEVVLGVPV